MDRVTNYAMQGCSNNDEIEEVEAAANAALDGILPPIRNAGTSTPLFLPCSTNHAASSRTPNAAGQ
jgi:hypothetical protein